MVYYERMTGIVPTLKPNNSIRTPGQHIYNGTLALVTPLCSYHNDSTTHNLGPYQIEESQARDDNHETSSPQLPILHFGKYGNPTTPCVRSDKRQEALDDQEESKARKKI